MKRKGISLITLIITIVVVIILAAAVILTLGDNNPVNSSKLASLLKSKETMEECIKIVVADKIADTLGQATVKGVVTELDDTEIVDNSELPMDITKDGENLKLYKVDPDDYKNKFGVQLSNTPSTNSKWYVDEKGRMFLVYDFIEKVPEFMKDNDTTLNKSVEPFVIVTGKELEESIIESAEITLPELPVGIGEAGKISVNLSQVKNLSYCKWEINNSSDKLGTEDENLYPNTLESNNAEISLANITEVGNYYLHMLIVTDTSKVEKISSRIVVEKKPDVWDGTVATSFASGSGTELEPYIIETAEQFAYFASQVNVNNVYSGQYIKMVNSIDLNNIEWTPIGWDFTFKGNFDGGNNSILNLSITKEKNAVGLFGKCQNATIKNLIIESGSINMPSDQVPSYIGVISGRMNTSEISNCVNKATITAKASYSIGGIVGSFESGTVNTTPEVNINDCYNYGNITLLNSPNRGGAGIVGYTNGRKLNIANCGNYGNIQGESSLNVAGIISYMGMQTEMNRCFNEGILYGKSTVGGIISGGVGSECYVSECYNSGYLTSVASSPKGILGTNVTNVTISYCYNAGTLESIATDGMAGIARSAKINNCYNTGKIVFANEKLTGNGAISINSNVVSNCYYLKGSCQYGYYDKADVAGQYEVKEEKDFTADKNVEGSVVNLLNQNITDGNDIFVIKPGVNNGYPSFTWQK